MSESIHTVTRDEFADWVHDALNRLYDSPYLRRHPLGDLVLVEEAEPVLNRSQELRRLLLEAIEALRPPAGVPAQSTDWRLHRILELRFLEGLGPGEAMDEVALSRSQYFREQARALQVLTDRLWDRFRTTPRAWPTQGDQLTADQLARTEADRLRTSAAWEVLDLAEVLSDLRSMILPLAEARGLEVRLDSSQSVGVPHADRVMLRQCVLGLVSYALDQAVGGRVDIGTFVEGNEMGLRVAAQASVPPETPSATERGTETGLHVCRRLVEAMGGQVRVAANQEGRWQGYLLWPAVTLPIVLVIDDNKGLIDVFRRYLGGHPWEVRAASSGSEARQMLSEIRPTVIVLDVMMPGEDGWEVLTKLKAQSDTAEIPVIVCSVLDEPHMAQLLGASEYLPKPVTQRALLRALLRYAPPGASPGPSPQGSP